MIAPDIIATIRFYTAAEGGRTSPITREIFTCPFKLNDKLYECGILLKDIGYIYPGEIKTVPIKFISSIDIKSKLTLHSKFYLWDGRNIAEGNVEKIYL